MLSVRSRAEKLATFRFVMVQLMETLARWVPSAPEMEAKVLFGQHIWDVAQHADALGRRVHELRSPLHSSRRPAPGYQQVLDQLAAAGSTADRVHGLYDVVLPRLALRYERYAQETDALLDAPSVRIVETILRDFERMRRESEALRQELPRLGAIDAAWQGRLAARG
jgi:hypothetical protein